MNRRFLFSLVASLLILFSPIFAFGAGTHVHDNANLLSSSEVASLESDLSNLPVWVETASSVNGPIDAHAAALVKKLSPNSKGFLICVTTSDHKWRIAVTPANATVHTDAIGGQMVTTMKAHQFYQAFRDAGIALTKLDAPVEVARSTSGDDDVTITRKTTTTHSVTVAAAASSSSNSNNQTGYQSGYRPSPVNWNELLFWTAVTVGILLAVFALILLIAKLSEPAPVVRVYNPEPAYRPSISRDYLRTEPAPVRTVVEDDDEDEVPQAQPQISRYQARQIYSHYTPQQRQTIVNNYAGSPHYNSSVLNDPLSFYLFMNMVGGFDRHPYPGYGYGNGYYNSGYGVGNQGGYGGTGGSYGSGSSSSSSSSSSDTTTTVEEVVETRHHRSAPAEDTSSSGGSWSSPDTGSSSSSDSGSSSSDSGSGGSWGSDSGSSSSDSGSSSSDSGSSDSGSGGSW